MFPTVTEKPRPVIDDDSRPYWQAAREHRLSMPRCKDCGAHIFYPRALCTHCYSDNLEWVDVSGDGEIYSFTISRRGSSPVFKADAPYVVAVVQLKEGPRMLSTIVTDDVDAVEIGQKVRVIFEDVDDELTLPKFQTA